MSILDPSWKYTPSNATDIRKTFAKARKQLEQERREKSQRSSKVTPLKANERS